MTTKTLRKIVHIDEEKCDGCGVCIPSCAEGALQIVDGKAKLIREKFCDGLGACLGECPRGAITIEELIAEEFDEDLAKEHLASSQPEDTLACSCPSSTVEQFDAAVTDETLPGAPQPSMLGHWPVQLTLVPPKAPFLQGTDLMLTADCVPFAYAGFHRDFIRDHSLLVACPKLDDFPAHLKKLTDILSQSDIKSLTVVHMEVPCCSGLVHMAREAIKTSRKNIRLKEVIIGTRGEVLA